MIKMFYFLFFQKGSFKQGQRVFINGLVQYLKVISSFEIFRGNNNDNNIDKINNILIDLNYFTKDERLIVQQQQNFENVTGIKEFADVFATDQVLKSFQILTQLQIKEIQNYFFFKDLESNQSLPKAFIQKPKKQSKCIFNGNESCECKACQCIRRNRNSAFKNQSMKREALKQLEPLEKEFVNRQISIQEHTERVTQLLQELEQQGKLGEDVQQWQKELEEINNIALSQISE